MCLEGHRKMNPHKDMVSNEKGPDQNVTTLQGLAQEVKKLNEKVQGIERNLKRPLVKISSFLNSDAFITDEQRLKDGVARFIEFKTPERQIYASYVEYYKDISKRMVADHEYRHGNYIFTKKKYDKNSSQMLSYTTDDWHWTHETSVVFFLHPKDETKYLQLAPTPGKEHEWSTKNATEDYYQEKNDEKYLISCCIKRKYSIEQISGVIFWFGMVAFVYIFYKSSSVFFAFFPCAVVCPFLFNVRKMKDDDKVFFLFMTGFIGAIYLLFKVSYTYGIVSILVLCRFWYW